jgi:hypothetical protein
MYFVLNKTIGVKLGETFQWVWKSYRELFNYLRKMCK